MLNKSILIGRLVVDPELKTTQQGTEVCSFRIAVDRAFTPKGGEKQTDFLNIVAWRNSAIFTSKYFHKGKLIGIEGSIQSREYIDKDKNKRYAVEVIADRCFFVGDKSDNNSNENSQSNAQNANVEYSKGTQQSSFETTDDSDLPF